MYNEQKFRKNSLKNYKKNEQKEKHLESIKCEQKSMIKNYFFVCFANVK